MKALLILFALFYAAAVQATGGLWDGAYDKVTACEPSCCCLTSIRAWQDGTLVSYTANTTGNCPTSEPMIGQFQLQHPHSLSAEFTTPSGSNVYIFRAVNGMQMVSDGNVCTAVFQCASGDCLLPEISCDASASSSQIIHCETGAQRLKFSSNPSILAYAGFTITNLPNPAPPHTKIRVTTSVDSTPAAKMSLGVIAFNMQKSIALAIPDIATVAGLYAGTIWDDYATDTLATYNQGLGAPAPYLKPLYGTFQSFVDFGNLNDNWMLFGNAQEGAGQVNNFALDFDLMDDCASSPCPGSQVCVDLFNSYNCVEHLDTCEMGVNCFYGYCGLSMTGMSCQCYPGLASGPQCATVVCDTPSCGAIEKKVITDNQPVATSLIFKNQPMLTSVSKLRVAVRIFHEFSDDVIVSLVAPNGVTVQLARHKGVVFADIYDMLLFDMQSPFRMVDFPFASNGNTAGYVVPQESFSAFDGTDPNGEWFLHVIDTVPLDDGLLDQWTLSIDFEDQCASANFSGCEVNQICVDGFQEAKCECAPGWTGPDCLQQVDACHPNPCANFGDCQLVGTNGFHCSCFFGLYGGDLCDIPYNYYASASVSKHPPFFISSDVAPLTTKTLLSSFETNPTFIPDLRMRLTLALRHPYNDQLTITLTAPSGKAATVANHRGGPNTDVFYQTVFDDDAMVSVVDADYAEGQQQATLKPEQAFKTAFAGEAIHGVWTLTIVDDVIGGDGILSKWDLQIDNNDYCGMLPCEHGGVCQNVFGGQVCDCSNTGYSGARCEIRNYCAGYSTATTQWQTALSFETSQAICKLGYSGSPTRVCDADGVFGAILGDCVQMQCPAEVYGKVSFGATLSGETATGTCAPGWSGAPQRVCMMNGQWDSKITSPCTVNKCAAMVDGNTNYATANPGVKVYGVCSSGFIGSPYRVCQTNGQFGPAQGSPCKSDHCATESYGRATWPSTPLGSVASGACDAGYTGAPTRICKLGGDWQTLVSNPCRQIRCPATNDGVTKFNEVAAGSQIIGTCLIGTGRPVKRCDLSGVPTLSGTPCH